MDNSILSNSPIKRGSFSVDMPISRPDSMGSPGLGNRDRFAEKDSLYLDMGKPDLNGRIDTLANGSHNNSILLQRADSNLNVSRDGSVSAFGKNVQQQPDQKSRSKSFRGHHLSGANQSFLKAAIFRNMQKNSEMTGEDGKEDDYVQEQRASRRGSDARSSFSKESPTNRDSSPNRDISPNRDGSPTSSASASEVDSSSDICHENPQVQINVEKIKAGTPEMRPSKNAHSPMAKIKVGHGKK